MPVLSVFTLIAGVVLFILGQWQWDRYRSKLAAPAEVAAAPVSVLEGLAAPAPDRTRVFADGVLDPRRIEVYAVQDGVRGARVFSPLVLEAGAIFVDRGFVPETRLSEVKPPATEQVRIEGVLRPGAKANRFTPDNDPRQGAWFWPDVKAMADELGVRGSDAAAPSPASPGYYIAMNPVDPLGTGNPATNPWADTLGANQVTPERHFGYALTWWGLLGALIGVYVAFHLRAGRLRF